MCSIFETAETFCFQYVLPASMYSSTIIFYSVAVNEKNLPLNLSYFVASKIKVKIGHTYRLPRDIKFTHRLHNMQRTDCLGKIRIFNKRA